MIRFLRLPCWFAALMFVAPGLSPAQTQAVATPRTVGRIVAAKVVGTATVTDVRDPMRPRKLSERDELTEGQIINTGENSRVLIVFSNGATVNLAAKSSLSIDEFLQDPFTQPVKASELTSEPTSSTTKLNLIRGELMSNVKHLNQEKGSTFSVQTPVGAAGIRGTTFQIVYRPVGNTAMYALRMVEGRIRLDFGPLSRPVEVNGDEQVVLENIPLDAAGRVTSLPADIKPTAIPAAIKASLVAAQQMLLEAGASVTFPPSAAANPNSTPQAFPQSASGGGEGGNNAGTTTGPAVLPLSPVPPATPPAPRTTPGDGRL